MSSNQGRDGRFCLINGFCPTVQVYLTEQALNIIHFFSGNKGTKGVGVVVKDE